MTADLAPFPLPQRGFAEVLSAWTGEGSTDEFFRVLALIGLDGDQEGPLAERTWLEDRAARERANRVLVGQLRPLIEALPDRARVWTNALPAETRTLRVESPRPAGSVDWTRTSIAGWPPSTFHLKVRERTDKSVLARMVNWTVGMLLASITDAKKLAPSTIRGVETQLLALQTLAAHPVITAASGLRPTSQEVRAVRSSGRPWAGLAPIADRYLRLTDVLTLANELIVPDVELAWRLFHLACFGEVLAALSDDGCDLTAIAPLYGGSMNPAYVALVPDGSSIDIWFEASGCWRYYAPGVPDPYRLAAKSASRAAALSPDILLVRTHGDGRREGLVLECKSGDDAATAARDGYLQVVSYGAQLNAMSGMPVTVWVVGRDDRFGLPTASSLQPAGVRSVGMVAGGSVGTVVSLWLADDAATRVAPT